MSAARAVAVTACDAAGGAGDLELGGVEIHAQLGGVRVEGDAEDRALRVELARGDLDLDLADGTCLGLLVGGADGWRVPEPAGGDGYASGPDAAAAHHPCGCSRSAGTWSCRSACSLPWFMAPIMKIIMRGQARRKSSGR